MVLCQPFHNVELCIRLIVSLLLASMKITPTQLPSRRLANIFS